MSHRIGGGVRAGTPIIGQSQIRESIYAPLVTEDREARIKAWEEQQAERNRLAAIAHQKQVEYDLKVQQMLKDSAPVGSIISTVGDANANFYCESFQGRATIWVLVRLETNAPEPYFILGSSRRFGMRAFLTFSDVQELLSADDFKSLDEFGHAYPDLKIKKVKVIGKSQSGKSLTVKVVE